MTTNWENFRKNLGEWHGSFTAISPTGDVGASVPSILILADTADGQRVRFELRRFGNGLDQPPTSETVQEYATIGRQNVFFRRGLFLRDRCRWRPLPSLVRSMALSWAIADCGLSNSLTKISTSNP